VKAGAWRAGNADAPDGRQDLAGALIRGHDLAGALIGGQDLVGGVDTGTGPGRALPQDRTWPDAYAWRVLGDAFILPGLKPVRYIAGPEAGPRIITTRGMVAGNTDQGAHYREFMNYRPQVREATRAPAGDGLRGGAMRGARPRSL